MHFPTRLSGAVESVMFSHSHLISRWAGIVLASWYRFFLFIFSDMSVVSRTFFPMHFLFVTAERMPDRKAILSQARQIAANVLKLCEAMNRALFVSNRERASKLTCVSTRTLSRINAEPGKKILASKKSRSLTTLTSVFCGGHLMKCTGARRYDQLQTGFKPDTFHATSPVSFLEQDPNSPRSDQVPATMVLSRTVGRLLKQQANVLASDIGMLL